MTTTQAQREPYATGRGIDVAASRKHNTVIRDDKSTVELR